MARISLIGDEAKGPHEPCFESSRRLWGTVPSFYRVLAHSPEALEHIIGLGKALAHRFVELVEVAGHPHDLRSLPRK